MSENFTNPIDIEFVPEGWQIKAIQDICLNVTSGGTPFRGNSAYYENGTINWFKTKELKGWYLTEAEERITETAIKQSSAKILPANTILMAMYGDGITITSLGILKFSAACNQACCALIANPQMCDYLYLFYALKYHKEDFIHIASGGAQRNLSGKLIKNFAIKLPPLSEQRAIAHILGSLNDKIELNRRMNATLEATARALFQSWFVDFDPVHAKARGEQPSGMDAATAAHFPDHFEDSPLGPIPAEWKFTKLGEFLSVLETGDRPKGGVSDYTEGIPSIGAESIVGLGKFDYSKTKYVPENYFKSLRRGILYDRDVLLYKDGGRPGIFIPHVTIFGDGFPFKTLCINSHVYRLRSEYFSQEYLYFWVSSDMIMNQMHLIGGGAAIPGINAPQVRSLSLLVPSRQILEAFSEIVRPVISQILANCNESRTLSITRDALLPKLISGEVRVENMENLIEGTL